MWFLFIYFYSIVTEIYTQSVIYTFPHKYWHSEASSFILAEDLKHLGFTWKYEYETREQHFSSYFQVVMPGSAKLSFFN